MSFYSINKTTRERVNSLSLIDNPKYEFPEKEDWVSDGEGILNFDEVTEKHGEIRQVFVNQKTTINYNGTSFITFPHFRIPNSKKLGINYIPESIEHKIVKGWIYKNYPTLQVCWSINNKKPVNPVLLSSLPVDLNKLSFSMVEEEGRVTGVKSRIADVLFIFDKKHLLLGDGIVFEVQFSKQRDSTEHERTMDWGLKGFSVCWVKFDDIKKLSESDVVFKEPLKVITFASILRQNSKECVRDLKFAIQEETRKISNFLYESKIKMEDSISSQLAICFSNNPEYNSILNRLKWIETHILNKVSSPVCDKCQTTMLLKDKNGSKFWGCPNYWHCKGKTKAYSV